MTDERLVHCHTLQTLSHHELHLEACEGSPGNPEMKVVRSTRLGMRARSFVSRSRVWPWAGRFMLSSTRLDICCSGMSMYLHTCDRLERSRTALLNLHLLSSYSAGLGFMQVSLQVQDTSAQPPVQGNTPISHIIMRGTHMGVTLSSRPHQCPQSAGGISERHPTFGLFAISSMSSSLK